MAVSYNVKIVPEARLRKSRRLSVPGDVLVRLGDVVAPDTIVAKSEYVRGSPRVLDLNSEFRMRLTPEQVDQVMLKKIGESVAGQEPVARYQKGFWSEIVEVKSPCDGIVEHISRTQGRVIIREDPRHSEPSLVCEVAKHLNVWPRLIGMYTRVKEGDFVYEGQVIASVSHEPLFGEPSLDYVYAPAGGTVEKICPKTGTVTIVRPVKPSRVLAHISGIVTEVFSYYGAAVESRGAYLQGVFGLGGEAAGEIIPGSDSPSDVLGEAGVTGDMAGKVVLAGSMATSEALSKLKVTGAAGLAVGGLNNLDLVSLLGKEINVGTTGQEDVGFTIVITEGFGQIPMNPEAWQLLSSFAGKVASMDGTTQIRAGVIRPEILISKGVPPGDSVFGTTAGDIYGEPKEEEFGPLTHLAPGDRVRCVRAPYFGLWGTVTEIPEKPMKVASEAMMEVVKVRLDRGDSVFVAEANLEMFRKRNLRSRN